MKKTSLITCLLLTSFFFTLSFSQEVSNNQEADKFISNKSISLPKVAAGYLGSPYANKEFQRGSVYKNGKVLASNVAIRYNAKRDEIEIKSGLNTSNYQAKVLSRSPEIYVKVLNKLYVYSPANSEKENGGYFLVMHEGEKLSIYKKLKKEFIEGKKSINTITRDVPPTYKDKEHIFFVDKSGTFIDVPKSRNGRLKVFETHKKELKQYVRDYKLNLGKDYDLLKLVKYYNSL